MSNAEELYDSARQNVLSRLGQEAIQSQRYKEGSMEAQAREISATGAETVAKAQEGMAGVGTGSALATGIGAIRGIYKSQLGAKAKTLMKKKLQQKMKQRRGQQDGEDDNGDLGDTNSTTNLDKSDNSTTTQDPANPTQADPADPTPSGSDGTTITKKTGENFGDEDDIDVEPENVSSSAPPSSNVGQQAQGDNYNPTPEDPETSTARPQLTAENETVDIEPAPTQPTPAVPAEPVPPKPTDIGGNAGTDANAELDTQTEDGGNMASKLTNLMKGQGFSDSDIASMSSKLNAGDSSDITDALTDGFSSLLEEGGSTMLGTALDFLGPIGALAGVGLGIYGAIEGTDEEENAKKNATTFQNDLTFLGSAPALATGSIAMPTMDTTQLRTGMMNF